MQELILDNSKKVSLIEAGTGRRALLVVASGFTNHEHDETVADDGGDNVSRKGRRAFHPDSSGLVELTLKIIAFLRKFFFVPSEDSFRITFGAKTELLTIAATHGFTGAS